MIVLFEKEPQPNPSPKEKAQSCGRERVLYNEILFARQ